MSPISAPLPQLELVHAELNRQRDATADKHRTMYQRAALVIGAATVVTGVQSARIPSATSRVVKLLDGGIGPHGTLLILHLAALVLAVAATVTALVAAILGTRTIMVETGGQIDVVAFAEQALQAPADLYAAEWSLVRDKLGVHVDEVRRLESRRLVFTRGAALLVVAWTLAILQFATSEG